MKKGCLLTVMSLLILVIVSCSSENEHIDEVMNKHGNEFADYAISFDLHNIKNKLKVGDSIQVSVTPKLIGGTKIIGDTQSLTRVSPPTPMVGTITDLGTKVVTFKRNSGDNLVPIYFTRQNSLCHVWKISLRIEYPDDDTAIRGFKGEFTGWSGRFIGNTQERFQGTNGDSDSVEFYTYVYQLVSDIFGVNTGDNLFLPVRPEEVRIYVRFS